MMSNHDVDALGAFVGGVAKRNPHEEEFIQAVCELAHSVFPVIQQNSNYRKAGILERVPVFAKLPMLCSPTVSCELSTCCGAPLSGRVMLRDVDGRDPPNQIEAVTG